MSTRPSFPGMAQSDIVPTAKIKAAAGSRFGLWLNGLVLTAATIVFTGISVQYIADPLHTAAAFKITLGSPAAVTNMRVGFGAFPLGFGVIILSCLVNRRRHLLGLYLLMTIMGCATMARVLGIMLDGPAAESLKVLPPEVLMLTFSLLGIFLELRRRHSRRIGRPEQR